MTDPWRIYDQLIDEISPDILVTAARTGVQWCRVTSSEGGIGMAYTIATQTRPPSYEHPTFTGTRLRDVAALAKSWNLAEAGIGVAAINAWYSHPERSRENGFRACPGQTWTQVFDPYAERVAGARVAVIGHFPFAPKPLSAASELYMLERNPRPGDYPDSACEYLLPRCDYVFISSSAFVNKTMPRLLELARAAHTVAVGPSTPLNPVLFDHGVDVMTGFVSAAPERLDDVLANLAPTGMYDAGHRVQQEAPGR